MSYILFVNLTQILGIHASHKTNYNNTSLVFIIPLHVPASGHAQIVIG
jgi:hypothetical protein